jgi:hypothetical protein
LVNVPRLPSSKVPCKCCHLLTKVSKCQWNVEWNKQVCLMYIIQRLNTMYAFDDVPMYSCSVPGNLWQAVHLTVSHVIEFWFSGTGIVSCIRLWGMSLTKDCISIYDNLKKYMRAFLILSNIYIFMHLPELTAAGQVCTW